ncbi:hypothetical protein HELRODRAFT_167825 [Helobdella robusta]|uniref:RING-type domain-containing protein n=1 Tax=Helobdella robusta TaxID=6412 RepID=T1EZU4_HELRO|nr:hypothetical protein HELRODRAFT_167825 [Helobdella robusta]ESO09989.1 hypothetical protein HELRODRAFT_167825 [Helobdella robusta]
MDFAVFFDQMVSEYVTGFTQTEEAMNRATYDVILKDIISQKSLITPADIEKIAAHLFTGVVSTANEEAVWSGDFRRLSGDQQYDIYKEAQDKFFENVSKKPKLKTAQFNQNNNLYLFLYHRDSYYETVAAYRTYKLPYSSGKFLHSECMICLEDFKEKSFLCQLKCKHAFHTACLALCFKDQVACPICRQVSIFNQYFYGTLVILFIICSVFSINALKIIIRNLCCSSF